MRRLFAAAIVLLLVAEALPLVALEAWHCSCRIKSLCCREKTCPMDLARRAPQTDSSFAACGGASERFVPSFLRWRAVVRETPTAAASTQVFGYHDAVDRRVADAELPAPDHPPRVSFS